MPIFPTPPLDDTITPGQLGHIADHEAIHTALNLFKGNEVYNVKGYGAVGDNSNDDTTAIQDAIDAASAAGGGVVFVPEGAFKTTAPIDIPSNVTLCGTGMGSSVLYPTGGWGACLRIKGAAGTGTAVSYAGVKDLGIQGSNGAALTGDDGIHLDNVNANVWLQNVRIRQVRGRGVNLYRRCFEVRGFNVYIIDTKQTGLQFGDPTFSASDDQANGNSFHGVSFGPMSPRCIDFQLGHSNRIFDVDIQSPPTANEWVRFTNEATNNTIFGLSNFDAVAAGADSCVKFDGAGVARNHIHDWELGMTGVPIFKFANGAAGNVVTWGRYTGSPDAVYTADSSSTSNWIDGMYMSLVLADAGSSFLTQVTKTNRQNTARSQTQTDHFTLAPPTGVENIVTKMAVNAAGVAIPSGTAVGIKTSATAAVSNGLPLVTDSSAPWAHFFGITFEELSGSGTKEGRVVVSGYVQTAALDTSASALGASVWCGASGLTLTQPDIGTHVGRVATLANPGAVWVEQRPVLMGSAAYTPTNVTPDRAFDADTVLVAELADVVGTLIADLKSIQILK